MSSVLGISNVPTILSVLLSVVLECSRGAIREKRRNESPIPKLILENTGINSRHLPEPFLQAVSPDVAYRPH